MGLWLQMLNMVGKRERGVTVISGPILLSSCFSLSILNLVRVFSMTFTSFTFAVGLIFIFVNAFTFLTFVAFTFAFLFLILLLKFCVWCLQYFLYLLSLSLLLFEERFPRVEFLVLLRLLIFQNRVCEDVESSFQGADCLERERQICQLSYEPLCSRFRLGCRPGSWGSGHPGFVFLIGCVILFEFC